MGFFDVLTRAESVSDNTPVADSLMSRDIGTLNQALQLLYKQNSGSGDTLQGRMPAVGVDAIIQDWVRQQFIYRRSILQDLFVMSLQVTEIRSVIMSIKRSVFRRGLGEWIPKFGRKCIVCEKEFADKKQENCDECYLFEWADVTTQDIYGNWITTKEKKFIEDSDGELVPSPTREPHRAQKESFENLMGNCNIFKQSMLDVLKEFLEDVLVADDGFLVLNKEYIVDRNTGEIQSQRIVELARLHPALIEFDIDRKDGLPERSHWLCVLHRAQQVHTGPGECNQIMDDGRLCGTILVPAMYRYYMRGRYRYYTSDEIIHKSAFSPSRTYGYSYDTENTEILTNSGFKYYKDVEKTDKLATVNPDTYMLEYHPYDYKWEYDYKGDAYHIQGQKIDQLVTPNHKMLVANKYDDEERYEFVDAENIKYYHQHRADVEWKGEEQEYFVLPEVNQIVEGKAPNSISMSAGVFSELMGLYVARGSKKKTGISISFNENNQESIVATLDKTGMHYNPSGNNFIVNGKALVKYVEGGKEEIIEEFSTYSPEYRHAFANTALKHIEESKSYRKIKSIMYEDKLKYLSNGINTTRDLEDTVVLYGNTKTHIVHHPEIKIPMDDWLKFLGWYIAEGSVTRGTNEVSLAQYPHRPNRRHIEEACLALPFKWGVGKERIRTFSKQLSTYLVKLGYSHEKYVPDYVFDLSRRQINILLDAYRRGDGDTNGNCAYTTSDQLKDNLLTLGLKAGFAVTAYTKTTPNRDIHTIRFIPAYGREKIATPKKVDFDGKMGCFFVPPNNTLIVKRNGKVSSTGNSPVLTVFEKVLTILGIDRWYYRYFYERRIPPGLVITYTDDPESLETEIERMKLQMLEDPNTFPWIAAAARTQRGRTDFVKLGYTFEEMDSVSIRQEIRERVGMLWGVTPMQQGDSRAGGSSLSRENAQTSMYHELIEWYQTVLDNGVLDKLLEQLGVTDWKRMLATPYGKTDQERLELDKLTVDVATAIQNLGYKPILDKESDMAKFDYEEMENPFGAMGGQMGMGGMGGGMPMSPTPGSGDAQQQMGNQQQGVDPATGLPLPPPPDEGFEQQFEPSI